jgi:hypothetical protein
VRSTRPLLALLLSLASLPAGAQQLAIRPGLWEKKLTITPEGAGGEASEVLTVKACLTPENLDTRKTLALLSQGGKCTVKELEASSKRLAVSFQCGEMSGESTTEVRSDERVVVEARLVAMAGGKKVVSRSSEEWRYLGPDCPAAGR